MLKERLTALVISHILEIVSFVNSLRVVYCEEPWYSLLGWAIWSIKTDTDKCASLGAIVDEHIVTAEFNHCRCHPRHCRLLATS